MAALLTKGFFVLLVLETLLGMVANGSIMLINFIDWFRKRKLSPTDLILTCLGSSRLLLLATLIVNSAIFIWYNGTLGKEFFMLMAVRIFTNALNLWLAACLSVFYLAKIAIFSHPVFLRVKQRFSALLPWLLLGSVVVSAVVTIVATPLWMNSLSICYAQRSLSINWSNTQMNTPRLCWQNFALISAFNVIPFMVFLSSSICLISSLWKHVRRVRRNGTGSKDLNTQAHWSAIKALASFAILYLISYVAFTLLSILILDKQHTWATVFYNLCAGYPSGHSVILILINPKLKQAWVRVLRHLKCGSRCKM